MSTGEECAFFISEAPNVLNYLKHFKNKMVVFLLLTYKQNILFMGTVTFQCLFFLLTDESLSGSLPLNKRKHTIKKCRLDSQIHLRSYKHPGL